MSTFDDQVAAIWGGSTPGGNTGGAPQSPPYTPPVTPPSSGVAPPAPAPYNPGGPMQITYGAPGPVGAQYAAATNVMNAQQADINATRGYYDTQGTLIPYSAAELQAREAYNASRGAYLAEQTRALAAERAETAGIIEAKKDVGNIQNVALAERERAQYAYRYQLAGLPTPVEITLPEGHTGPLPAGVQARLRTLAEILEDKAKDSAAMRKFNIEAARIHAETTGLAVTAAEIASGRQRLSIDEVELAMRRAGLDVNQATLDLNRAQQAPPGMVLDEESNRYVTPAEARQLSVERQRAAQDAANISERGIGDLSPLSLPEIMSFAVTGGLGVDWESMVRTELEQRAARKPELGYTPGFINIVVAQIRARLPEGEKDDGFRGPPIGDVTPSGTPTAPVNNGGWPGLPVDPATGLPYE